MTRFFANLRVSTKVMLPLVLLALVALGAGGLFTRALLVNGDAFGALLEADRQAATDTNRLVVRAVDMARGVWLTVATPEPAVIDRTVREIDALDRDVLRLAVSVRAALAGTPHLATLDLVLAEFPRLRATAQQALDLLRAGRVPDATALLRVDFQKRIDDLRENNRRMSAGLQALAEARSDALDAESAIAVRTNLAMLGLGIALSLGICILVTQTTVLRPLHRLDATMQRLAAGDLSAEVRDTGRGDEIGRMARALRGFAGSLGDSARLRSEQEALRARAEQDRKAGLAAMAGSLEASVGGVVEGIAAAAAELNTAATSMVAIAEQTNARAGLVGGATAEASGNVNTVAAATEELAASVNEISRQVADSARLAGAAVDQANRTNATVANLTEAAAKIGEVTRLIGDIAGQTNLLALNATIEAARAGEAGKGFAVVASEVKALANQTAQATGSIATQIKAMQEAAREAAADIGTIRDSIGQINEVTAAIAASVEEQGAATREIAQNVQRAATGTSEIAAAIDGVTEAASHTGDAAGQVQATSATLAGQADRLRREVGGFLERVRAA